MNFFERIAGYEFRLDRDGNVVFCPCGSWHGGAIIPTETEETRVRKALARCYRTFLVGVWLPTAMLAVFGHGLPAFLWMFGGLVWFVIMRHRIVRGFNASYQLVLLPRRNTDADGALASFGFGLLLAAFCLAVAFGMFYSASLSASPTAGLIGGSTFAALAAIALYAAVRRLLS